MRKLKNIIFSFLVLVGTAIGVVEVHAESYGGAIKAGNYVSGPYYYMHTKGTRTLWEQSQFIIRTSDGGWVYCVQPFAKISADAKYEVTTEDIEQVLNISQDTWREISRISYYGYGYSDGNIDHSAQKWYVATQMLIWQKVAPDIDSFFTKTLKDFREDLLKQPEPEAKQIALSLDLYTIGSLDTFAKETNVDTKSRIICYDILDLGSNLLPVGMLIVLDSILNRITQNRAKGRNTYIFIDEIYLLFKNEYAANFLFTLWKRVRKYGAYCTGITQNVDDLLQSHTARTMLANSEFIVMLNQSATDSIDLAKLLDISDTQKDYITNVSAGEGLLKIGRSLVPFKSEFPKDTELYKLMTTKPGE